MLAPHNRINAGEQFTYLLFWGRPKDGTAGKTRFSRRYAVIVTLLKIASVFKLYRRIQVVKSMHHAIIISCILFTANVSAQSIDNSESIAHRLSGYKRIGVSFNKELGLFGLVLYTEAQADKHKEIIDTSVADFNKNQEQIQKSINRLADDGRDPTFLVKERDKPYRYPFADSRRLYRVVAVSIDNVEIELADPEVKQTIVIPFHRIGYLRTLKELSAEAYDWWDDQH